MARKFCPVRQAAAPVGRYTTLFGRIRHVAAEEAKSAVSDASGCVQYGLMHVVHAESTNTFKSRLDKFWSNQEIIYDYCAEIQGGKSKCNLLEIVSKYCIIVLEY